MEIDNRGIDLERNEGGDGWSRGKGRKSRDSDSTINKKNFFKGDNATDSGNGQS